MNFDDDVDGKYPNMNPYEKQRNNTYSQDNSIIMETIETEMRICIPKKVTILQNQRKSKSIFFSKKVVLLKLKMINHKH